MAFKTFCDICNKESKNIVRVNMGGGMYCKKCWLDKKNWEKIHKKAIEEKY